MAAGFAESYIRLWSLKGEKLKGMRSDFSSSSIRDCKSVGVKITSIADFPKSRVTSQNPRKERKHDTETHWA